MRHLNNYAVTEALAFILVVMISISSIGFIIVWGMPFINQKQAYIREESSLVQFGAINDVINDVASSGVNGSTFVEFVTDTGQLSLRLVGQRFVFYYSFDEAFDFNVSGLHDGDGRFTIFVNNLPSGWSNHILYVNVTHLDGAAAEEVNILPDVVEILQSGHSYTYHHTTNSIEGAIQIDLSVVEGAGVPPGFEVGRIWLFDPGCIEYKVDTSYGHFEAIAENGAVIAVKNANNYLKEMPFIYKKSGSLIMRIIQLLPQGTRGAAGEADYSFLVKANQTTIVETKAAIPEWFKTQIYGDQNASWITYFLESLHFKESLCDPLLLLEGKQEFTLIYTRCEVSVTV